MCTVFFIYFLFLNGIKKTLITIIDFKIITYIKVLASLLDFALANSMAFGGVYLRNVC